MGKSRTGPRLTLEPLEARDLLAVTIGAMGDSYTDETGPGFGFPNWTEILVAGNRADFGPLRGDYASGDPRRGSGESFEYNFALGGARASSFVGCGHNNQTGCAIGGAQRFRAYATSGALQYGSQFIGGNDFIQGGIFQFNFIILPYPFYQPGLNLFNSTWNNFITGLNLATATGTAPVGMLLGNLPDLGTMPFTALLPQQQRDNLRTWIEAWNYQLAEAAAAYGYGVFDVFGLWEQFRGSGGTTVHGIPIDPGVWDGQGGTQGMRHFFLGDGLHGTPIAHAILANQFLTNLNETYGTDIPLLTPKEMVTLSLLDPQRDPVAQAGGPYTIVAGNFLTVQATGSTDPNPGDVPLLEYAWDLNGDESFDDAYGFEPTLSWKELEALGISAGSTFSVRVRVDDTFGGVTVSDPVELTVNPPEGPRPGMDGFILSELEATPAKRRGVSGGL